MTDRRWPLLLSAPLVVVAVVVGAWGYDVLELTRYAIGCLLGIVTTGLLWITVLCHPRRPNQTTHRPTPRSIK